MTVPDTVPVTVPAVTVPGTAPVTALVTVPIAVPVIVSGTLPESDEAVELPLLVTDKLTEDVVLARDSHDSRDG